MSAVQNLLTAVDKLTLLAIILITTDRIVTYLFK